MRHFEFIIERKKKKKRKATRFGYFYPGYSFNSGDTTDSGGGDGGGGESIYENVDVADEVEKFKDWTVSKLSIQNPPEIELSYDTEEAQEGHHTGRHIEGSDSVWVYAANRNLVDILRTVFHELVHWRQSELNMIEPDDSYPGSAIEAMADMLAGKYIKIYGKQNRQIFQ